MIAKKRRVHSTRITVAYATLLFPFSLIVVGLLGKAIDFSEFVIPEKAISVFLCCQLSETLRFTLQ